VIESALVGLSNGNMGAATAAEDGSCPESNWSSKGASDWSSKGAKSNWGSKGASAASTTTPSDYGHLQQPRKPQVFLIPGSALKANDWLRAGLTRAHTAVLLASPDTIVPPGEPALVDSQVMLAYIEAQAAQSQWQAQLAAERQVQEASSLGARLHFPLPLLVAELSDQRNMQFFSGHSINPHRSPESLAGSSSSRTHASRTQYGHHSYGYGNVGNGSGDFLSPAFASGQVLAASMFDSLIVQVAEDILQPAAAAAVLPPPPLLLLSCRSLLLYFSAFWSAGFFQPPHPSHSLSVRGGRPGRQRNVGRRWRWDACSHT
jgi:hypothetical protein